jgi:multimeric flavodoxin WrbA
LLAVEKKRGENMRVLVLNSSPKMDKGNTALVLGPFLEGVREAGAEVELFYTKKLEINPCQGEFNCWFKTPGKCFQQDDMQMLLPMLAQADIWVLATPVYQQVQEALDALEEEL